MLSTKIEINREEQCYVVYLPADRCGKIRRGNAPVTTCSYNNTNTTFYRDIFVFTVHIFMHSLTVDYLSRVKLVIDMDIATAGSNQSATRAICSSADKYLKLCYHYVSSVDFDDFWYLLIPVCSLLIVQSGHTENSQYQ